MVKFLTKTCCSGLSLNTNGTNMFFCGYCYCCFSDRKTRQWIKKKEKRILPQPKGCSMGSHFLFKFYFFSFLRVRVWNSVLLFAQNQQELPVRKQIRLRPSGFELNYYGQDCTPVMKNSSSERKTKNTHDCQMLKCYQIQINSNMLSQWLGRRECRLRLCNSLCRTELILLA